MAHHRVVGTGSDLVHKQDCIFSPQIFHPTSRNSCGEPAQNNASRLFLAAGGCRGWGLQDGHGLFMGTESLQNVSSSSFGKVKEKCKSDIHCDSGEVCPFQNCQRTQTDNTATSKMRMVKNAPGQKKAYILSRTKSEY